MMMEKIKKTQVTPDNVFWDNNGHLYFTLLEVNIIGVADIENGLLDFICGPIQEKNIESNLYGGICRWRDFLVLAPYNASKIWIYNLSTKEWKEIETGIDDSLKNRSGECFSGAELIDDDVYFFGYGCSCILKLNLNSFETDVFVRFDEIGSKGMKLWAKSYVRIGKELYIAVNDSASVMKVDCEHRKAELIELGSSGKFAGITEGDEGFWVISYLSDELILWDEKNESIQAMPLPNKLDVWGAAFAFGKLFFFHPQNNTVSYDTKNSCFDELDFSSAYIKRMSDKSICFAGLGFLKIVDDTGEQKGGLQFTISVFDDVINDMFADHSIVREGVIKETTVFGLDKFIKAM